MKDPVTVAIVDDHLSTRELIAELIDEHGDFKCIGSFSGTAEAIEKLPALRPKVVLMDINMPGRNGIEIVRILAPHLPETNFIMLTVYEQSDYIFNALAAGAVGYLLKRSIDTKLIEALRQVVAGGSPMNDTIARMVVRSFKNTDTTTQEDDFTLLSDREMEVLSLLSKGRSVKQIADMLGISVHSIYQYSQRAYRKLHVHSCVEAVAKYVDMNHHRK